MTQHVRFDRNDLSNSGFCDQLSSIGNLPASRNIAFIGREEAMSTLEGEFFSSHHPASVLAIKGMGGIGKTQIALEYAYRLASRYEAIWWIRAEDEVTLAADYASFATTVNLPEKNVQNEKVIIDAVRCWLERNRNWLFIFNNAVNPDQLSDYLPQGETGHVLITTRHQMWDSCCHSFSILFFLRKESVNFLLNRSDSKDLSGAESVAEQLGNFPLSLELASAYIRETAVSFTDYLESVRERHETLWEDRTQPLTYPDTIGTIISLSLEKLEKETPAAVLILSLCSYYAPDHITPSMFTQAKVPEQISSFFAVGEAFEKGVTALNRFSLVNSGSEGVSIHSLVQAVMQDHLNPTDQEKWSKIAVSTINTIFPSSNYRDPALWLSSSTLLSHGRTVVQHAVKIKSGLSVAADLLDSMGSYLHVRGSFLKAEANFRLAIDLYEKQMGINHPHVGAVADNLAVLYQEQGNHEEAATLFRRALEIYRTKLGDDHLYVGAVTNHFASLLRVQGRMAEAETLFRKSREIYQTQLGHDHPKVATSLNNLAVILQDQGKVDEAEKLLRKALDIYETKLVDDHPYVATSLNNLAGVLHEKENFAESKALYKRALDIFETRLGDCSLQVVSCTISLARLLKDEGKYDEAEALYRKTLHARQTQLDADHLDIAASLTSLADVLHEQGKFTEAETVYRQAMRIHELQSGEDCSDTARNLNNLAVSLCHQGGSDEAEPFFRQALYIHESVLGSDHPDTVVSIYNLSVLLKHKGKQKESEELLSHVPAYFTGKAI